MLNRMVTTTLMAGTVVVAALGTGVAIGASTQAGVHACSSTSAHRLGLIKNGKCAHGFKRVTLGAQGPRGRTGPQGPGAIEEELSDPGDDVQHTFATTAAGITVHASCTLAGNPSIELEAVNSGQLLDFSGTQSSDGAIAFATEHQTSPTVSISGTNNAGFDVVARAGTAPYAEIRVGAAKSGNNCQDSLFVTPAKAAG
jgi:hypothetical protein